MSAAGFCRSAGTLVLLAALIAGQAGAQSIASRLPITLDAESSELDLRNDRMVYRGLRIAQGAISIEAENGTTRIQRGDAINFANSVWTFGGNVRIEIETASIRCEAAELYFQSHTMQRAEVRGSPATFHDSGRIDGREIRAQANSFSYDLAENVVRFTGDARIAEGDSEVSGADLLYDLATQRVQFSGDVETGERVRIVITPEDLESPERPDRP